MAFFLSKVALLLPEELPLANGLAVFEHGRDLVGVNDADNPNDDPDADAQEERRGDYEDDPLGRLAQINLPCAAQQEQTENQSDDRVLGGTGGLNLSLTLNEWHGFSSCIMK